MSLQLGLQHFYALIIIMHIQVIYWSEVRQLKSAEGANFQLVSFNSQRLKYAIRNMRLLKMGQKTSHSTAKILIFTFIRPVANAQWHTKVGLPSFDTPCTSKYIMALTWYWTHILSLHSRMRPPNACVIHMFSSWRLLRGILNISLFSRYRNTRTDHGQCKQHKTRIK